MGNFVELSRSEGQNDLRIMVDDKVNFDNHIQQLLNKANSIIGLITRTYTFLDETSFRYLFQALVRRHLEYVEAVWSLCTKKDIHTIEFKMYKESYESNSFLEKYGLHKPTKKTKNANITIQKVKGRHDGRI